MIKRHRLPMGTVAFGISAVLIHLTSISDAACTGVCGRCGGTCVLPSLGIAMLAAGRVVYHQKKGVRRHKKSVAWNTLKKEVRYDGYQSRV